MPKRTDVHSIVNLDPAAYTYIDTIYQGPDASSITKYDHEIDRMIAASTFKGNHHHKGTCDHCGAYFHYGAVYQHDNGDVIVVGHQCAAESFGLDDKRAYDLKRMKERAAGGRKAAKARAQWAEEGIEKDIETDHYIVRDIKAKALRYGSLSPKQIALVKKLAAEARAPKPEKPKEPEPKPVREGKGLDIVGTILSVKYNESDYYGPTIKMLIRTDYGAKLWGTFPASLDDEANRAYMDRAKRGESKDGGVFRMIRGWRVKLIGNVKASPKDPCFGFIQRPRKASFIK